MNPNVLQLISLPLELFGVLLAMLEVFSPNHAERANQILRIANNMRGLMSGLVLIATLGLSEAKVWQRILVVAGLILMISYFFWSGNQTAFIYMAILWPSTLLIIMSTYLVAFALIKFVSSIFPTRVLGIWRHA